jgi:hypothetical protein
MDELQDLTVAASTSTLNITGRGVALFGGGGGGFAVLSADAIDREGLTVPRMPKSAIDKMREYIPVAGSSVNNPIDAFPPPEHMDDMLRVVATAEGIDMLFMSPMTDRRRWHQANDKDKDKDSPADPGGNDETENVSLTAARNMRSLQDDTGTPVVGIVRSGGMARMMGIDPDDFFEAAYSEGIGSFPSVARAARTVNQLLEWRKYREGLPDIFGS